MFPDLDAQWGGFENKPIRFYGSLLTERIRPHYEKVGLTKYFGGASALQMSETELVTLGAQFSF